MALVLCYTAKEDSKSEDVTCHLAEAVKWIEHFFILKDPIRDGEGQVIQSWASQKLELPLQGN